MTNIDFGRTLAYPTSTADITRNLRPVEGLDSLIEALYRRFETEEGSLPWDPKAGYRLANLILENAPDPNAVRQRVEAECKKDDRVNTVSARVRWSPASKTLYIHIEGESGVGPFKFAITIDQVSMNLLRS